MTRQPVDPAGITRAMREALERLADPSCSYGHLAPHVTARALVRRGLAYRDSARRLTITDAGRAAINTTPKAT